MRAHAWSSNEYFTCERNLIFFFFLACLPLTKKLTMLITHWMTNYENFFFVQTTLDSIYDHRCRAFHLFFFYRFIYLGDDVYIHACERWLNVRIYTLLRRCDFVCTSDWFSPREGDTLVIYFSFVHFSFFFFRKRIFEFFFFVYNL